MKTFSLINDEISRVETFLENAQQERQKHLERIDDIDRYLVHLQDELAELRASLASLRDSRRAA